MIGERDSLATLDGPRPSAAGLDGRAPAARFDVDRNEGSPADHVRTLDGSVGVGASPPERRDRATVAGVRQVGDLVAKRDTSDLRRYAVVGAKQRLLELADETAAIYATLPEPGLRGRSSPQRWRESRQGFGTEGSESLARRSLGEGGFESSRPDHFKSHKGPVYRALCLCDIRSGPRRTADLRGRTAE